MAFHGKHLCTFCGCHFEEHAGVGNPDCPEGRCPATKVYGVPRRFPSLKTTATRTEEKITLAIKRYWTQRKTIFLPVS